MGFYHHNPRKILNAYSKKKKKQEKNTRNHRLF